MSLGLTYLFLVCFVAMAVSEYRKEKETKGYSFTNRRNGYSVTYRRIYSLRFNLGRWGRAWNWQKREFIQHETARERLAEAFNTLDVDQDGFIDMNELKDDFETILKGYTRGPKTLMADTDTNKDGKVDFEEFFAELGPSNGQM